MILNRKEAPPFQSVPLLELKRAESQGLHNGIGLHSLAAGEQAMIRLDIQLPCGISQEGKDEKGLSYLMLKMLMEGTSHRSSKTIAETIDFYGATLSLEPGIDYATLSLYCLSKHLEELLPLLVELLLEPSFPEHELSILKEIKSQQIKLDREKSSLHAAKLIRQQLFGQEHPYGTIYLEEDIMLKSQESVRAFHTKAFDQPWDIFLAGDVKNEHLKLIEDYFSKISFSKISGNHNLNHALIPQKGSNLLLERPESLQSSFRLGKTSIPKKHPDYIPFLVCNEIFGGYFGSRLMKNIREDKGYTYGIFSSIYHLKEASLLLIGADVIKEHTQDSLNEIKKEISNLQQIKVGALELETAKNYMMGSIQSSIDTPLALMDRFKSIYNHGLDYSYYDGLFPGIMDCSAELVMEMAQVYLNYEDLSEVIIGAR